jgi:ribosomal protein S18 acetylase RimI-like enzyme
MNIRKFQDRDAGEVSVLIKRCLRKVNSKDYSKKVIDFMCKYFTLDKILENSKKLRTLVVIDDNEVLGTASLRDNKILMVFVDPRVQGKGVGKKLVKKLESLINKKIFQSVKLFSSITAINFYKKLGYKEIRPNYDKNFGKTILMSKFL